MNATSLTKQNFLIVFHLSQTYHRTWDITLRQILLRDFWLVHFFFSGTADYEYYIILYHKKISYSPYDLYNHTTEHQASCSFRAAVWNFPELLVRIGK